jgi:hypothetical protein
MVFLPSKEAGELGPVPDSIPICEFILNEKYGRVAHDSSRDPYTCGLTGKSYSSREVIDRVDHLARGLSKEFGWAPNQGSEWDKTLAVFALNTVGETANLMLDNKRKLTSLLVRSTPYLYSGPFTD